MCLGLFLQLFRPIYKRNGGYNLFLTVKSSQQKRNCLSYVRNAHQENPSAASYKMQRGYYTPVVIEGTAFCLWA